MEFSNVQINSSQNFMFLEFLVEFENERIKLGKAAGGELGFDVGGKRLHATHVAGSVQRRSSNSSSNDESSEDEMFVKKKIGANKLRIVCACCAWLFLIFCDMITIAHCFIPLLCLCLFSRLLSVVSVTHSRHTCSVCFFFFFVCFDLCWGYQRRDRERSSDRARRGVIGLWESFARIA